MHIWKKLFILIIAIISVFIIYFLLKKREQILKVIDKTENKTTEPLRPTTKENFLGFWKTSPKKEIDNLRNLAVQPGISNYSLNNNFPLKEFFIKSSYNSATSGKNVSKDMVHYVLSRGCRFLDFSVYSLDGEPVISLDDNMELTNLKETENAISVSSVLETVTQNGFMHPSPNPNDPLFIQLTLTTYDTDIYDKIANSLIANFSSRLYNGRVDETTILNNLLGKVIIVLNKTHLQEKDDYKNSKLHEIINMETGGNDIRIYKYDRIIKKYTTPPNINDDKTTDILSLNMVIPENNIDLFGYNKNHPFKNLVIDHGIQIIPFKFYTKDHNLIEYEKVFRDNKTSFVPISRLVQYMNEG